MRRLLVNLLEGLPVTISECSDGARAVEACGQARPDYVAIDFDLADTDALAAVREMIAAQPGVRVVLLGQEDDHRLRARAVEAGVWRYVLKERLIEVRRLIDPKAEEG